MLGQTSDFKVPPKLQQASRFSPSDTVWPGLKTSLKYKTRCAQKELESLVLWSKDQKQGLQRFRRERGSSLLSKKFGSLLLQVILHQYRERLVDAHFSEGYESFLTRGAMAWRVGAKSYCSLYSLRPLPLSPGYRRSHGKCMAHGQIKPLTFYRRTMKVSCREPESLGEIVESWERGGVGTPGLTRVIWL